MPVVKHPTRTAFSAWVRRPESESLDSDKNLALPFGVACEACACELSQCTYQ